MKLVNLYLGRLGVVMLALVLGFALASPAAADSIGGPGNVDCPNNSCQGATYTIFYSGSPISTTATTKTYQVTYEIDTSTYTGGGVKLDTVAIKVSSDLTSATLVAAPGGLANWSTQLGGLNSNGCSGSGSGFACAMATSTANAPAVGGTLTWIFNLEVPDSAGLAGPGESSIKARYIDASGEKVGDLVSEPITLQICEGDCTPPQNIPEPSSLFLLGTGILALARRRLR